jgi:glycosyltransferase involved in cell wall biosynthesis
VTPELTVLMPCLNEELTVGTCVKKALDGMASSTITGEVLVADNGSTDGSIQIAEAAGARVIRVSQKGYGNALMGGIRAAKGRFVVMGDCDDSYDFSQVGEFVQQLRAGKDLVMGNRFTGEIKKGAMPFLHRYLGNPVLTTVGRLFFSSPCGDFHCGLRGFRREAILELNMQTTGMEFASEMVIRATLQNLAISEIPTTLSPDGRNRLPHLRSWRDGWRHLRFMLLYSPRWLFLYPGLALILVGLFTTFRLFGSYQTNRLLYAATAILMGLQCVSFAVLARTFAVQCGLLPPEPLLEKAHRWFRLEHGLILGLALILMGLFTSQRAVLVWAAQAFGPLEPRVTLDLVIPSVIALVAGSQIIMNSLLLSILHLGLTHRTRNEADVL